MMGKSTLIVLCCFFLMVSSYQKVKVQPTTSTPPRSGADQVTPASTTCPACNIVPYNFTIGTIARKFIQQYPNVWSQLSPLTDLGTRFLTYIQSLDFSSDPYTVLAGVFSTFVFNYFIADLVQKPDACAMAAMINATVACNVNRNQSLIQGALIQLRDSYLNDISPRLERTMALRSGCDLRCGEYPPDPKVKKAVCYENGLVYPIQQILNLPSPNSFPSLSSQFKTFISDMYNSTEFNDKFFAVCASFTISGAPFELWNINLIAEIIDLTTSPEIPMDCCYQRMNRIEEIRQIYDFDVGNYTLSMRQDFALLRCRK